MISKIRLWAGDMFVNWLISAAIGICDENLKNVSLMPGGERDPIVIHL